MLRHWVTVEFSCFAVGITANDDHKVSREIYWWKYFTDVKVSNLDEFYDASIDPKTQNSYTTRGWNQKKMANRL